ncbi:MAG: efflux RND transporter permease subunit [Candidatus Limnocylindrales bacterium]
MYRITQAALSHRPVTLLIAAALFLGGIFAWGQLKSELLPNIDFPIVTVITPLPGAGASDVAEQVTKPVERAISTAPGLKSVQSTSTAGVSIVVGTFAYGTDIKGTVSTVQGALDKAGLPTGATPQVTTLNINALPVIQLTVSASDGQDPGQIVRDQVAPELASVPGVARVDSVGGQQQRVLVELDPAKLVAANVSVAQIVGVLQANDLTIPSGSIVNDGTSLPVTTSGTFKNVGEISSLIVGFKTPTVAPVASGAPSASPQPSQPIAAVPVPIHLSDLGTVALAPDPSAGISRTDGEPSVTVAVIKATDANTVDVSNGVKAKLDELQASLGPNVKITILYDSATYVEDSISGLQREGGLGAIFAVVVIFLFLLNVRSTLVAAISIPLSVLTALVLMLLGGVSLNIMTLGGLAVAVGRVVDDAIVVLENIFRHHRARGEPIGQAVLDGTREVSSAITSSTLTTVAVFLPIGFVGGLVTQFFLPFSLTVTFALLASLGVALTVVPVLAYYLVPRVKHTPQAEAAAVRDTIVQRAYTPILRTALRFRWVTLALVGALFVGSMALVPLIPTGFLNAGSDKLLQVTVTPPPGATPDRVAARALAAEKIVAQQPGVVHYQTTIAGTGDAFLNATASLFGRGLDSANITTILEPTTDLAVANKEMLAALQPLASDGYTVSVSQTGFGGGARLQIIVSSEDPAALAAATTQVTDAVKAVPDVVNVSNDLAVAREQVQVVVDPSKAIATGSTTAQIAGEIRTILAGQSTIDPVLEETKIPTSVFVQVDPTTISTPEALGRLPVGTAVKVPLSQVATIGQVSAPASITRVDQQPASTVSGDILTQDTGGVSAKVQQNINALGLPSTVSVKLAGITQQQSEGFASLISAMGFSILVVYVVMVLVFGSLLDPFIILFSLPLATIGAFVALLITGRPLGISALIGLLMLIGIVVTNAIVFMDLVEQLRRKGLGIDAALMQAGRTRVRPIIMTALATILALLPLGLGLNEGSIIASELATVVIGGLFTSTLLTLVVIPVVYSLAHGGKRRLERRFEGHSEEDDASAESLPDEIQLEPPAPDFGQAPGATPAGA